MKQKYLTGLLFMLSFLALAQTNTNTVPSLPGIPGAGQGTTLLLTIIPLLVPIILAVAKVGIKALPSWTLPILAPALGALLDYLNSLVTGHAAQPVAAAVLGSAGVGLRELIDQVKQKVQTAATASTPPTT